MAWSVGGRHVDFDRRNTRGLGLNFGTYPTAINAGGIVAVTYGIRNVPWQGGFIRGSDGTITTFASDGSASIETTGINSRGVVIGFDTSGSTSFFRSPTGAIYPLHGKD